MKTYVCPACFGKGDIFCEFCGNKEVLETDYNTIIKFTTKKVVNKPILNRMDLSKLKIINNK